VVATRDKLTPINELNMLVLRNVMSRLEASEDRAAKMESKLASTITCCSTCGSMLTNVHVMEEKQG
jgi:hypothetical protein